MWLEQASRSLVSLRSMTRADILETFRVADDVRQMPSAERLALCRDKVLATVFFQPSTRTRLSFESAVLFAGGSYISFGHPAMTKASAGETLEDTLRVLDGYADVIAVRHPVDDAAAVAAELVSGPVINAGCGTLEHPTQALVDLYAMHVAFGSVDGLTIGLMGDLRTQRAVSSLIAGLARFEVELCFICHPDRSPRQDALRYFSANAAGGQPEGRSPGREYRMTESLGPVLGELDVLYVIRIDRERTDDIDHYETLRGDRRLRAADLAIAKPGLRILNPLPRDDELSPDVDGTVHAWYFEQARLGRPLRAALLSMMVGQHRGEQTRLPAAD